MRWAEHVARMAVSRGAYGVSMRKLKGKRPLGRPKRRWEDNIKIDLQEVECGSMDWIQLAQEWDRWRALVNAVMNFFFFHCCTVHFYLNFPRKTSKCTNIFCI
jgi:hypothetical protein